MVRQQAAAVAGAAVAVVAVALSVVEVAELAVVATVFSSDIIRLSSSPSTINRDL